MTFVKIKKSSRGLSLVEMIVVVTIFSLLSLAVMESIASFYRFNAYSVAQAYQVTNARRGISYMVRDLREMTFADNGSFPIVTKNDHKISFYSDIDRDSSVEYVEYELTGTTLYKKIYNASGNSYPSMPDETDTISEYVQNIDQGVSTFTYYDKSGNKATATTTASDIAYVNVQVVVNIDPVRDPGEFMLRSSAALRNLKDN